MKKIFKGATFYILLALALFFLITFYGSQGEEVTVLKLSEFISHMDNDNIKSVTIQERTLEGKLREGNIAFTTYVPAMIENELSARIYERVSAGNITLLDGKKPQETLAIFNILTPIIMIIIFLVVWFLFMQNSQGGGSRVMSFGKSRAKLHKEDEAKRITFADVAGLDEEKEEMTEVVDFLRAPKKYIDLGARIPKGILMVGPPGTGKTYLTRAVAGEAGVPFFSISGSDFVEMFVGVGASRVRDLFENAKKNSPCIVFIDEIDAVGRKRGAGLGGGHDEREQTLNQLLVEMDGFTENQGIIIIAATNRPDILDPALLRPGRFDREIVVGLPDIKAREQILKVHARNKPISPRVNLKVVARGTPGFTPADLENLLNEAAIIAARSDEKRISMESIEKATTKLIAGVEKKSRVVSEKERRLTAYHEAGHAILAKLLPDMDPVHQVTIIPRGRAGGFTLQLPTEDKSYHTKNQLEHQIVILLGGRIAEKLILNDISTGASSDLDRVTKIARAMVTKYAMSDNLSQMSYDTGDEVFLGRDMAQSKLFSDQVQAEIDREVSGIVDTAHEIALSMLESNIDKLHAVAAALLEYETINGEEFDAAFEKGIDGVKEIRDLNDGIMRNTLFKQEDEQDDDNDDQPKADEQTSDSDDQSNDGDYGPLKGNIDDELSEEERRQFKKMVDEDSKLK